MANYLVWYGKKRAALASREGDLLRFLQHSEEVGVERSETVIEAAEDVRAAKIRLFRSNRSQFDRCNGTNTEQLKQLDDQIELWRRMPINEIILEYRSRLNRS